ncbi:hypothetical protein [Aquimarina sediminis]|uniref:hypothetical protein n=1 Tax=Aquimarina sediminis TaxID=2070536 RepID=UPI000FFECE51|nr:hypothetical protein [Aquimarina sediminis]
MTNHFYKKSVVFLCLMSFLSSCNTDLEPVQVVLKSLEAHGGIESWENAKEISYLKTTILYDSLGNVEKKITQKHINRFKPVFSAEMSWLEDSIQKRVVYTENKTSVFHGDSLQNEGALQDKYYKDIIAANYVLWQPYKLLDKEVNLSFAGRENIGKKRANVIQANYFDDSGEKTNTWWYYFDAKTNKLLGNMVHHGATYSYIENMKYENTTGLFLNAKRQSYRCDSLRNIKFLRAEYTYKILGFKKIQ